MLGARGYQFAIVVQKELIDFRKRQLRRQIALVAQFRDRRLVRCLEIERTRRVSRASSKDEQGDAAQGAKFQMST
jgi:hypothetical protein